MGIPSVLGSIRVSCLPISIGGVCWVLKRFELFYSMCCLLSNSVPLHCSMYYGVPGLPCLRGLRGTLLFCVSMVLVLL